MDLTRRLFLQATAAAGALASFPALAGARYSSGDETARFIPPAGSVDCHMHLYNDRYPAAPGATLLPPNATLDDYAQVQKRLHLQRFVIVTPSTYGTDNRCLLDGLHQSNGNARGVAVIAAGISDAELEQMNKAGVRGIRFNLSYGGASLDDLELLAHRVNELGWHVQVVAPGTQLLDLEPRLAKLPARLVIDHMGHIPQPQGIDAPAFATINRLLAGDRTWVKLSGPYIRSKQGAPDYPDVGTVAKALVKVRPDRLLWGSDWPHPTVALENKPDDAHILDLMTQWAPNEKDRNAILRDNPVSLYGF
ncbi:MULTISPECIES: amidohydrolase family protein [unclassified Pseudomonas]|uniref:amidohydrolase family protein n=1 Tax=unclassified Pseudomonas TaxID=196821 RepID=UPI000BCB79E5|nr:MULTISPECIES: amidohydrolase family protein [unclassified Pseudomonas]PVZ20523.1 putative TIM-barrel fold metal-dependent hydrolase [Pseudomonas sp. URIL14HWK12:I12]PVZ27589.1 putative TIM-barrel fold metal-dependent hydrolase [Pseudomonas sp. URIL14HWK12:I10]PVZ38478.1 putative TIM-barrel fold metal-dependent hydrolase [Pseudomonas sp. URIL14HWK12:I11]SNZ03197.1 Predicted metal-dependent hydrolase, TIM-barrel fold [Pseudomonas sp. URIL14HWK12:I9]